MSWTDEWLKAHSLNLMIRLTRSLPDEPEFPWDRVARALRERAVDHHKPTQDQGRFTIKIRPDTCR